MLLEAMKALGARSDQSVIIGDAVCDMQMGRAADILSFGVGWGCPPPRNWMRRERTKSTMISPASAGGWSGFLIG